jgi:hypothetical protein
VQDWLQFETFKQYEEWVKRHGSSEFDFKAFPALFLGIGNFFHFFFPKPPATPQDPTVHSVIGVRTFRSLRIDPRHFFAAADPGMVRQGDLFVDNPDVFPRIDSAPSHWVAVSQTCVIDNDTYAVVAPAYLKDHFKATLHAIKPDKAGNEGFLGSVYGNIIARFLPLPAYAPWGDQPLILDLGHLISVRCATLKGARPLLSLTYPGLMYFANRLAVSLLRDVERCDDRRVVKTGGK